ncbi:hypothetical protein MMC14_009916 [Varicellaria rhodocarpa]|nr:hypothetical protein [Varicellaria rhodocarpa]
MLHFSKLVVSLLLVPAASAVPVTSPPSTSHPTSHLFTKKAASLAISKTFSTAATSSTAQLGKYWPGWNMIEKFFPFGDSYTTVGFNVTSDQPDAANPIGNPPYPGYTSSDGPNWVDFLTTVYNQSFIETYNLAYGGAVVDSSLVAQFQPTVLDFVQQVNDEFIPVYAGVDNGVGWTSVNSLFAAFFGINDVGNSYSGQNATLNDDIFVVYARLVDQLYQAGARNFLFLNVPPVNLSPGTTVNGQDTVDLEGADIEDFNQHIANLATNLSATYPDATVFQFNTNTIFSQILEDPTSYPQTADIANTTGYCVAYENGTPTMDYFDASCGVPVQDYFWLNTLHPVFPVHNATASQIALLLGQGQ